jgi:hypothetical protein
MDLNPIMAFADQAFAVDGRIRLKNQSDENQGGCKC